MIELALTFDVEQWDARSRNEDHGALLRAVEGFPTTWFVTEDETQSTADRYADVLRDVMAHGHEVAAHVHFQSSDTDRQLRNVRDATHRLRKLGAPCTSFRGGAHVFDDRIAAELVSLGYRVDSSAVPGLVRTYATRGGITVAAFGDVWDCGPYWWRPGLLELPLAAFPLRRPRSFFRRRFRLPLLVSDPRTYGQRLLELARTRPDDDLGVVALGHSYDVEGGGRTEAMRNSLQVLEGEFGIRFVTVADLACHIEQGSLRVRVGRRPAGIRRALGRSLELGFRATARFR